MIWLLLIPLIVLVLQAISIGAELLMHDREKAKEFELTLRKKQRQLKEYQKQKKTKEMMEVQKELFGLMGKRFRLQMKSWIISMPLFLLIFWGLSGLLVYQPAYAGEDFEVGLFLKNSGESQYNLNATIIPSGDMQVVGDPIKPLELDEEGDKGDTETLWWELSSPSAGEKTYEIRLAVATEDGLIEYSKEYIVKVVENGELFYSFAPVISPEEIEGLDLEVSPMYRSLVFNVFGISLTWFWYYIILFFILSAALSPLRNRILWGHWKGIKHLEKLERDKNDKTNKEQN
ncbi:MAG: hypothetical protein JXB14_04010 [Candidatus Altiarchaeota archaeon]|nr:hypothetical protein [Candidatus Altiarchaeota archaeon]